MVVILIEKGKVVQLILLKGSAYLLLLSER
jgi:hypothetical protein